MLCKNLEISPPSTPRWIDATAFARSTGSAVLYCFEGCNLDLRRGCSFQSRRTASRAAPKSSKYCDIWLKTRAAWSRRKNSFLRCGSAPVRRRVDLALRGRRARRHWRPGPQSHQDGAASWLHVRRSHRRQAVQEPGGFDSAPILRDDPRQAMSGRAGLCQHERRPGRSERRHHRRRHYGIVQISELFVIARNSSFQYKGKAVDIRRMGRSLASTSTLKAAFGAPRIACTLRAG